jgi:hypothetical protein
MNAAHLFSSKNIVPLDDPLRWFASRMFMFGVAIVLGMIGYTVIATVYHSKQVAPKIERAPATQAPVVSPEVPKAPIAQPSDDAAVAQGTPSDALTARASAIFVGAPVYVGTTVIGHVSDLHFDEHGDIRSFEIKREKQTVPVPSSDIAWGDSMQPTKNWQWTMGKPSKGVLLKSDVLNSMPKPTQQ